MNLKIFYNDKLIYNKELDPNEKYIIGRSKNSNILLNNERISRNHACIMFEDDTWTFQDLESLNGSFCNNQKISSIPINNGTTINIQNYILKFTEKEDNSVLAINTIYDKTSNYSENYKNYLSKMLDSLSSFDIKEPHINIKTALETFITKTINCSTINQLPINISSLNELTENIFYKLNKIFKIKKIVLYIPANNNTKEHYYSYPPKDKSIDISNTIINNKFIDSLKKERNTKKINEISKLDNSYVTPLYIDNKFYGVLFISYSEENKNQFPEFAEPFEAFTNIISNHITGVIKTFYLNQTILNNKKVNQNINIARKIYNTIIPNQENRNIPLNFDISYKLTPTLKIGGDFLDYFLVDKFFYLSIADISGKGVSAALIVSIYRTYFKLLTQFYSNIKEIASQINRHIILDGFNMNFITNIIIKFNSTLNKFSMINAGHITPVLYSSTKNKCVILDDTDNIPLGINYEEDYKIKTYDYEKNDILVLFTDGLIEIPNKENVYDVELLMDTLYKYKDKSSKYIVNKIYSNYKKEFPNNDFNDDTTLIAIKKIM